MRAQNLTPPGGTPNLALCPAATESWYDGVGHMPFWEMPERFDRELAGPARNAAFVSTSTTRAD